MSSDPSASGAGPARGGAGPCEHHPELQIELHFPVPWGKVLEFVLDSTWGPHRTQLPSNPLTGCRDAGVRDIWGGYAMKYLGLLALAVVLLLGTWFVLGPGPSDAGRPAPPSVSKPAPTPAGAIRIPTDTKDKPSLARSAPQLWKVAPDRLLAPQCLELMKLLTSSLDDQSFKTVAKPMFFGWEHLRKFEEVRPSVMELSESLVPRFARLEDVSIIEALVKIASSGGHDASLVDRALNDVASGQLRAIGYILSQLSVLVAASMRAGDFERAKRYLATPGWSKKTPPPYRVPVERMRAAIEFFERGIPNRLNVHALVKEWSVTGTGEIAKDTLSRDTARDLLEKLGMSAVEASERQPEALDLEDLLRQSGELVEAKGYWGAVLGKLVARTVSAADARTSTVAALARAYSNSYGEPHFEMDLWLRLAEEGPQGKGMPVLAGAEYLKKAVASARDDARRIEVIRKLGDCYLQAKDASNARKVVEDGLALVSDTHFRVQLAGYAEEVRKKDAENQARIAAERIEIERTRVKGRLDYMKEQLAEARRRERPAEDLRSIEEVVADLERQLEALK